MCGNRRGQTPSNLQKQKGGERTLSKRVKAIEEEEEEEEEADGKGRKLFFTRNDESI